MDELIYEITSENSCVKLERKDNLYCLYVVMNEGFYFYYDQCLNAILEKMIFWIYLIDRSIF